MADHIPMTFMDQGSTEYLEAFSTLLRGTRSEFSPEDVCRVLTANLPGFGSCVDWGCGTGERTAFLAQRFERTYAVDPYVVMCDATAANVPSAIMIQDSVKDATLPEKVDFALLCHVLYHLPDSEWAATVLQAAAPLKEDGTLAVVLKHSDSQCNDMIAHFGSERWNLFRIVDDFRRQGEFTIELLVLPSHLEVESLEDAEAVARFMLSDRDASSYTNGGPTEEEFKAYVKEHFWNEEEGRGGWNYPEVIALIRRNPFKPTVECFPTKV
jgi:SAM-dependent methyltransferase